MELSGTIQGRGALTGSFDFDQADYNLLKNKPSINGVTLIGNKTSEDLHINSGGGGGGTTNYNNLENKPKINGVILQDELSLHSLGIQSEINFSGEPTEYLNGEGVFTNPPYWVPVNYDTAEQNTGIKWINGKDIFQITITNISLPNAGTITINTPPSIEHLVKYFGNAYNADLSNQRPLPFSGGSNNDIRIDYVSPQLRIVTYSDWTAYSAYLIIQYTKTTD